MIAVTPMSRFMASLTMAVALVIAGCRPSITLRALTPSQDAPELAHVSLQEIDNDIIKFVVFNRSDHPIVILRDEVLLVTAHGVIRREAGGLEKVYNVRPGEAHELNVRFDFSSVAPGEVVRVRLDQAITIDGNPVPVPPFEIRRED